MALTTRSSDTRILKTFARWVDSDDGGAFHWEEVAEASGLSMATLRKYYDAVRHSGPDDAPPKLKTSSRDKLIAFLNERDKVELERVNRKCAMEMEQSQQEYADRKAAARVNTPDQVLKRRATFPPRTVEDIGKGMTLDLRELVRAVVLEELPAMVRVALRELLAKGGE